MRCKPQIALARFEMNAAIQEHKSLNVFNPELSKAIS